MLASSVLVTSLVLIEGISRFVSTFLSLVISSIVSEKSRRSLEVLHLWISPQDFYLEVGSVLRSSSGQPSQTLLSLI